MGDKEFRGGLTVACSTAIHPDRPTPPLVQPSRRLRAGTERRNTSHSQVPASQTSRTQQRIHRVPRRRVRCPRRECVNPVRHLSGAFHPKRIEPPLAKSSRQRYGGWRLNLERHSDRADEGRHHAANSLRVLSERRYLAVLQRFVTGSRLLGIIREGRFNR